MVKKFGIQSLIFVFLIFMMGCTTNSNWFPAQHQHQNQKKYDRALDKAWKNTYIIGHKTHDSIMRDELYKNRMKCEP